MGSSVQLMGRTVTKSVEPKLGVSLLQHALQHDIDWQHLCTRGTCARCRCFIEEGMDHLEEPTQAEHDRLDPEEMEEGFRLGCQAVVKSDGNIIARNKTYF